MKKLRMTILFSCLLFSTIALSGSMEIALAFSNIESLTQNSLNDSHSDEIILKFKFGNSVNISRDHRGLFLTGYSDIDSLNIKYKCINIREVFQRRKEGTNIYEELNLGSVYILKFESISNLDSLLNDYSKTGKLEYVEPNFVGKGGGSFKFEANDQYFFRQWSLRNDGAFPPSHPGIADADIDMDDAWEIEQGDSTIIVAILDSGCKLDHPELTDRIWINNQEIPGNGVDDDGNGYIDDYKGWDFAYEDNNPVDNHGHGTNVTGIIGATGNNNIGYAGIDWNCKLMICQIFNEDNWGSYSCWAQGIYYAINNGADVINMSVGGSSYSWLLEDAVNYAYQNNVTIVASMNNENNDVPYYPAAYPNTIAVGATDTDDNRCNPFFWGGGSNYGGHIDVVAPGNYIYGLNNKSNTNYCWYWGGTSQAAPHVTGLVSLLLAQDRSRTVDEIVNIIINTAEDQVGDPNEDTAGWDEYYGYGRINAMAALNYVTGIEGEEQLVPVPPVSLIMAQNYPNPFNLTTTITYYLPKTGKVTITTYNALGQVIETLVDGYSPTGKHSVVWVPESISSGLYFYKISTEEFSVTKKCIIAK